MAELKRCKTLSEDLKEYIEHLKGFRIIGMAPDDYREGYGNGYLNATLNIAGRLDRILRSHDEKWLS